VAGPGSNASIQHVMLSSVVPRYRVIP
jgi:hypothetical protein